MLKQLRRKFVLVNMLLVSLVLVTALSLQLFSFWRQTTAETDAALRSALQWGEGGPDRWHIGLGGLLIPGQDYEAGSRVPSFCVVLGLDGTLTAIIDNHVDISEETLAQALSLALNGEQDQGDLPSLGLRWLRAYTGGSLRVAFADTTWERAAMGRQALTALLVLAVALLAFLLVSLFLSHWALRPTERSWKQQQQFVADASHELKTPLTILLADADILLAHRSDTVESQLKWVEYIQAEARRMKELVEDLLFLARSDCASRQEQVNIPVSLTDLCWNCLLSFEPVAFELGVRLEHTLAPQVSVPGSEEGLRRLVIILLDNACKYCGRDGAVSLSLTAGDKAILSVHNTGPSIPPEAQAHLFERFYRADPSRDRRQGGYGLGLAIAAAVVEQHHGRIAVHSTEEEGTTFTVTLPGG